MKCLYNHAFDEERYQKTDPIQINFHLMENIALIFILIIKIQHLQELKCLNKI